MSAALVERLGAVTRPCTSGEDWVRSFKGTAQQAWDACPQGEWLLWLIGRLSLNRSPTIAAKLISCALDCALVVRDKWPEKDRAELDKLALELRVALASNEFTEFPERCTAMVPYLQNAVGAQYWSALALYSVMELAQNWSDLFVTYDVLVAARQVYKSVDEAKKYDKLTADIVRIYFPKPPRKGDFRL